MQFYILFYTSIQIQFKFRKWILNSVLIRMNELMNEWMMHLYSALLCIVVHPKRFTIMWGGGGGLSSTTTISAVSCSIAANFS